MAVATHYATGKRKNAIARAWLLPGSGEMVVNARPLEQYFPRPTLRSVIQFPLEVTGLTGKYNVQATVCGGRTSGQAGALRHSIAQALPTLNPQLRQALT